MGFMADVLFKREAEVACANCRKTIVDADGVRVSGKLDADGPWVADLCSWSCLTEWAFAQREKQPKFSKSKVSE